MLFRSVPCPVDHHIECPLVNCSGGLVVLAPDSGGMGRARRFRNALERRLGLANQIGVVYLDKERSTSGQVKGSKIVGDVTGRQVIILDDMISSGSTVALSADAVRQHDGEVWAICATHGMFVGRAAEHLAGIDRIVVTDTIVPFQVNGSPWEGRLHVIPTAMMFAQAIRRTHEEGGSISDLLKS